MNYVNDLVDPNLIDLDVVKTTMLGIEVKQLLGGLCVQLPIGPHHNAGVFRGELRVTVGAKSSSGRISISQSHE